MSLRKSIIFKIFILGLNIPTLFSDGVWIKYGWELFDYNIDARSASLGNAGIAYNLGSIHSSMINPMLIVSNDNISITHQSRFAGMINNDLIGVQLKNNSNPINLNVLYQGISNIPDTREMLLDWGQDGQFGTNDLGEGNGIVDEGERLDEQKLKYFNQYQLGMHGAFITSFMGNPIGLGYKILSYSLSDHYAMGIGIDIGYNKKIKKSSIGFVIRNIPASGLIWDNGTVEGTKPSMSIGLHHPIDYLNKLSIVINTLIRTDFSLTNTNLDSYLRYGDISIDGAYGFEIVYDKKTMLRIGKNSVNDFTGGIGLRWNYFGVDYAFINALNSSFMGNHHLISLIVSSNWIISRLLMK